jgi:uncharacterized protein with HEPN domain
MQNDSKVWLFDILQSIEEVEKYFTGKPMLFENFKKDIKTKRAVERNLEIIGEALGRILKKDPSIQITNARKVVDTRNRIAHGYDVVSDDLIWGIVINHLPKLKEEIVKLTAEMQ